MFAKMPFQYQIDGSFDAGDNVAFFFSRDQCVKANYSPDSPSEKARLLQAPTPISVMFPCREGTIFEGPKSNLCLLIQSRPGRHFSV